MWQRMVTLLPHTEPLSTPNVQCIKLGDMPHLLKSSASCSGTLTVQPCTHRMHTIPMVRLRVGKRASDAHHSCAWDRISARLAALI